jgi:hypothetical protein
VRPSEREIQRVERERERNRELERNVRWASHLLGRTTAPGLVGHSSTTVKPVGALGSGAQTRRNPFLGK